MEMEMALIWEDLIFPRKRCRFPGVAPAHIPYAVVMTGVVNVITTIIAIFIIEKAGRRKLILIPCLIIALIYLLLTACLTVKVLRHYWTRRRVWAVVLFEIKRGKFDDLMCRRCFRVINCPSSFICNLPFSW